MKNENIYVYGLIHNKYSDCSNRIFEQFSKASIYRITKSDTIIKCKFEIFI